MQGLSALVTRSNSLIMFRVTPAKEGMDTVIDTTGAAPNVMQEKWTESGSSSISTIQLHDKQHSSLPVVSNDKHRRKSREATAPPAE